jgi:ABC-type bacteriocin/lantibiotic exporter with double-glycine peptidase domain
LAAAARQLGVPGELRQLNPTDLTTLGTPLIAWVDRGHFVTVLPESARAVLVLDPQVGPYRIGLDRLRRYWSGEALVPVPARNSAAPISTPSSEGEETI